ncbi:MAG: hypothetical protein K6T88_04205 [Bacillus sp. (in: Bacteria)]|nr:hypothetical protein [Bacillus sp. (in: firmicutes)]
MQDIQRKQTAKHRHSHCRLANEVLRTGNESFIETMNYQGLQKRAKETKISEKTGKFQRKKRFRKSIVNKAPALFVSILEYKCKYLGAPLHKINTWSASLVNTTTKQMSIKRKNSINDGVTQAILLFNATYILPS